MVGCVHWTNSSISIVMLNHLPGKELPPHPIVTLQQGSATALLAALDPSLRGKLLNTSYYATAYWFGQRKLQLLLRSAWWHLLSHTLMIKRLLGSCGHWARSSLVQNLPKSRYSIRLTAAKPSLLANQTYHTLNSAPVESSIVIQLKWWCSEGSSALSEDGLAGNTATIPMLQSCSQPRVP